MRNEWCTQATCLKQQIFGGSMTELTFRVGAGVPSAAPLKYSSITLWDQMNRIHHFDVFVRSLLRKRKPGSCVKKATNQPSSPPPTPERKRKMQKSHDAVGLVRKIHQTSPPNGVSPRTDRPSPLRPQKREPPFAASFRPLKIPRVSGPFQIDGYRRMYLIITWKTNSKKKYGLHILFK